MSFEDAVSLIHQHIINLELWYIFKIISCPLLWNVYIFYEFVHHWWELIEINLSIAVGVNLFYKIVPNVFLNESIFGIQCLLQFFKSNLSTFVFVKEIECCFKSILGHYALSVGWCSFPFTYVNLSTSIEISSSHNLIYFLLCHISVYFTKAIYQFFFVKFTILICIKLPENIFRLLKLFLGRQLACYIAQNNSLQFLTSL